jgi:hypothetical protein
VLSFGKRWVTPIRACKVGKFSLNFPVQAGLRSWETSRKSKTKFPFTTMYFLGLGDWQPHPTWWMTKPLEDIRTCRVYMCCVYSIYIFLYSVCTFMYIVFFYS